MNCTNLSFAGVPQFWKSTLEVYENEYSTKMQEIFKSKAYALLGAGLVLVGSGTLIAGYGFYLSATPLLAGTITLAVAARKYIHGNKPIPNPNEKLDADRLTLKTQLNVLPFSKVTQNVKNAMIENQNAITDNVINYSYTAKGAKLNYFQFKDKIQGYLTFGLSQTNINKLETHLHSLITNLALEGKRDEFVKAAEEQKYTRREILLVIDELKKKKGFVACVKFCGYDKKSKCSIFGAIKIEPTAALFPYFLQIKPERVTKNDITTLIETFGENHLSNDVNIHLNQCPANKELKEEHCKERAAQEFDRSPTVPYPTDLEEKVNAGLDRNTEYQTTNVSKCTHNAEMVSEAIRLLKNRSLNAFNVKIRLFGRFQYHLRKNNDLQAWNAQVAYFQMSIITDNSWIKMGEILERLLVSLNQTLEDAKNDLLSLQNRDPLPFEDLKKYNEAKAKYDSAKEDYIALKLAEYKKTLE